MGDKKIRALFWALIPLLSIGCVGKADESPNRRAEANGLTNKIRANSTASDVALNPEQRQRIYARVEMDTVWHHENTTLLIGTAYRNKEEKDRLVKQLPKWFASKNLDTRCMAMMIVHFLKVKGFEDSARKLAFDLSALTSRDVMQEGIVGYAETYLQSP